MGRPNDARGVAGSLSIDLDPEASAGSAGGGPRPTVVAALLAEYVKAVDRRLDTLGARLDELEEAILANSNSSRLADRVEKLEADMLDLVELDQALTHWARTAKF